MGVTGPAAAAPDALDQLRQHALELVNQARAQNGLPALKAGSKLDQAAQAHAEDMLRRRYYAHDTPEGKDPRDRYLAAGGSPSSLIEENIARCQRCPVPPEAAAVDSLQRSWMASPEHRDNILARGIDRMGFGIAGDQEALYAVQDFAGPGVSRGAEDGQASAPLPPDRVTAAFADALNGARKQAGASPLQTDGTLTEAARKLLPPPNGTRLDLRGSLADAIPAKRRRDYGSLAALAGACTGCGPAPTAADARWFAEDWLKDQKHRADLLDRRATRLGAALRADGAGGKTALVLVAAPR